MSCNKITYMRDNNNTDPTTVNININIGATHSAADYIQSDF